MGGVDCGRLGGGGGVTGGMYFCRFLLMISCQWVRLLMGSWWTRLGFGGWGTDVFSIISYCTSAIEVSECAREGTRVGTY